MSNRLPMIIVIFAVVAITSSAATKDANSISASVGENKVVVSPTVPELLDQLDTATEFSEIRNLMEGLAAIGDDEARDALISQLGDKRTHAFHACRVLEELSVERAYGPLTNLFWNCEGRGWRDGANHAAKAIGNTKADGAYEFLIAVLDINEGFYSHPYVRAGAAVGLGKFGDKRCVLRLTDMVKDADRAEYGATEALVLLDAKESAETLLEAMQDRNRSRGVRAEHVQALSAFDYRESIPAMIKELEWDIDNPESPQLLKELAETKERMKEDFSETYVRYRFRGDLIRALVRFDDARAINVIGKCLIQMAGLNETFVLSYEKEMLEYLSKHADKQTMQYLLDAHEVLAASEESTFTQIRKKEYQRAIDDLRLKDKGEP